MDVFRTFIENIKKWIWLKELRKQDDLELENKYGVCRICGCTDFHACVDDSGVPCSWVDEHHTLCSACQEK